MIDTYPEGDKKEDDLLPVQFKTIMMDINLTPGSTESIEFHKELGNTDATDIFKTEAIQKILKYKWQQSKKVL